jgi:DNA ligase D-like protein (predicted 3'-phosphoesterase)
MADALGTYRKKRNFGKTSEPAGSLPAESGSRFVIHRHSATAPHYDLRLEHNGVLLSWAVPKGPSLNPADKRLAVHTEDHPVEYIDFEGVIPEGEYGGGPMIVWDTGTWAPMGDPDEGLRTGDFKFRLWGEKLKGGWMLARLKPKPGDNGKENWLFFKEHDQAVDTETDILEARPESVKTGRRIEELVTVRKPPRPTAAAGAVKGPMPSTLEPQLATAADAPPKAAATGPFYLHEIKFDGYRTLAFLDSGKVRLITRAGLDWTHRYGLLPQAFSQLPCKSAILDGEIVVLDDRGISRFTLLQEALSEGPGARLTFYAFDLLYLDGWDLRRVPLKKRKEYLSQLIAGVAGGRSAIQ